MDKKQACHRLADFNEALYDAENDLENVRRKLWMEDDPSRKQWFEDAVDRLQQRIAEIEREKQEFLSEYSDVIYS
ncbi:MAG: hypothetical protein IJD39_04230 [Clostridia bacterium]|nr:hypothetical protein [Clostridia bacterium]